MDKVKIERINELAKKAKAGTLTSEETDERAILRREYINSFKNNMRATLESVRVENENGEYEPLKKCTAEEIQKKKEHHHAENCSCGHHHHHEHHQGCGCGHHHEDKVKH